MQEKVSKIRTEKKEKTKNTLHKKKKLSLGWGRLQSMQEKKKESQKKKKEKEYSNLKRIPAKLQFFFGGELLGLRRARERPQSFNWERKRKTVHEPHQLFPRPKSFYGNNILLLAPLNKCLQTFCTTINQRWNVLKILTSFDPKLLPRRVKREKTGSKKQEKRNRSHFDILDFSFLFLLVFGSHSHCAFATF